MIIVSDSDWFIKETRINILLILITLILILILIL